MDRHAPPARRRRWRLLALVGAVPVLVGAPLAYAAASLLEVAAPEGPTISFATTGTPPLRCATHPTVSSLQVRAGTQIIVANRTTLAATVDLGRRKLLDLAPGMGAAVTLTNGQHEIRMVPACVVVGENVAAVVTVLPEAGDPDPSPTPDASDEPEEVPVTIPVTPPGPVSTGAATGGGTGTADPGAGGVSRAPASGPTATSTGVTVAGPVEPAEPGPVLDGSLASEVIEVQAITLSGARDPKDGRLLAVIATICVFGVTAAIIRAIVSQRTDSMVSI